jgi:hypothetical protein
MIESINIWRGLESKDVNLLANLKPLDSKDILIYADQK